jgi:hypothetical protein
MDKVTVEFARVSIMSATLRKREMYYQPATMCRLLSGSRQADAEGRVTATAMRKLPLNHLGSEKITGVAA